MRCQSDSKMYASIRLSALLRGHPNPVHSLVHCLELPLVNVQCETLNTSYFLPNLAKDFATHTQLSGASTCHNAFGRRKNSNTDPREDPGDILFLGVNTTSRFTDTLYAGNNRTTSAPLTYILNFHTQYLLDRKSV